MDKQIIRRSILAALAAASATLAGTQAQAQAIDTLPPELKALYTENIPRRSVGLRRLQDAREAVEVVPLRILLWAIRGGSA